MESFILISYTYDRAGNRQSQTVKLDDDVITKIVYTYNDLNRLTQTSEERDGVTLTTTYTYDANGNQTEVSEKNETTGEIAVDKYKYDELNQLIRIEGRDGSKSEYTYYGTGLRASKNVNNSTAVFIYDGKEILAETTAQGTKTNIFGNNMIATTGTDPMCWANGNIDVTRMKINRVVYDELDDLSQPQQREIFEKRKILVRNIVNYIAGMTDSYAIRDDAWSI